MKNMSANSVLMDYLRIYVLIWQKIDFIWGMFITTYIPLIGFLHFYQGEIGFPFAFIFVVAIGGFTWINWGSLRTHYRIANAMNREYRARNDTYPELNEALRRNNTIGKDRLVFFTHGAAFACFLYLTVTRLAERICIAPQDDGWNCLFNHLAG